MGILSKILVILEGKWGRNIDKLNPKGSETGTTDRAGRGE